MKNWKFKYLRFKIKNKNYYADRKQRMVAYRDMLDKRFEIFETGGIVGDRIWDLRGREYLDYITRVKPIINKRIKWYEKQDLKYEQSRCNNH